MRLRLSMFVGLFHSSFGAKEGDDVTMVHLLAGVVQEEEASTLNEFRTVSKVEMSVGNPTTIECGGTYAFEIETPQQTWTPTLRAPNGHQVTFSTCNGGNLDTVIDDPCYNDDNCGLMSSCGFTMTGTQMAATIRAYSGSTGSGTLTVTCTGTGTGGSTHNPGRASDNHLHGETGTNSCPAGTDRIRSPHQCSSAAAAVGFSYGHRENVGSQPIGCYEDTGTHTVFFNDHHSGAAHEHGRPLCAKLCHAASDCSGHGTVAANDHKEDGCTCTCTDGFTGSDCGTPPSASANNPTRIECGGTYDFEVEEGGEWKPTVHAVIGQEVELSTCDAAGRLDTVIHSPCYNDDDCSTQSRCKFNMGYAETVATITAYGDNHGRSTLRVTCSGGPRQPLPTHSDFMHAQANSNQCHEGSSRMYGEHVCRAAAEAIGIPYREQENSAYRPMGCYVYDPADNSQRVVFFNGHVTGSPHPRAIPLCAKHCEAETDCSGHGTTDDVSKIDGCTCECTDGFSGADCGTQPRPVPCNAREDCSGHGTTNDQDKSDGCECSCTSSFRGDDCSIPPHCTSDEHCNGHATVDQDSTDGCTCSCANGWSGDDCSTPPPTTPTTTTTTTTTGASTGNPAVIECGNTYTFEIASSRETWEPTVRAPRGHTVELSTCGGGLLDTVIDDPCYNDDACSTQSRCEFLATGEPMPAKIKAYGSSTGTSRLTVTCTAGDPPPPPVPCNAASDCSGHGTTTDQDASNGCECRCTSGYHGERCSIAPPPPPRPCNAASDCSGHGTTTDSNAANGCECRCHSGFGGDDCSIQPTPPPNEGELHGSDCSVDMAKQITPPRKSGGCQRCTCVQHKWQCACSLRHRKELNDVKDSEFDMFAKAVNKLKADETWIHIAKVHAASDQQHHGSHMNFQNSSDQANNQKFLPWHRKFLVEVENRLQEAASKIGYSDEEACSLTIPYWNWALDRDDFANAEAFKDTRLGSISDRGSGNMDAKMCVKTGRFGQGVRFSEFGKPGSENPFTGGEFGYANCKLEREADPHSTCMVDLGALNPQDGLSDCILRAGIGGIVPRWWQPHDYIGIVTRMKQFEGINQFEAMSNYLETTIHGKIHGAIGGRIGSSNGHMTSFYSPYDPIFFLHHGFVDFLWSQWQDTHVAASWRDADTRRLNSMLWDGIQRTFPTRDVSMNMDIKDDNPETVHQESACVMYHERMENHVCQNDPVGDWDEILRCADHLVEYQRLHEVPRIRLVNAAGKDVCDPSTEEQFSADRLWLETFVARGTLQPDQIDQVVAGARDVERLAERTTQVVDKDPTPCEKSLCRDVTTMLRICRENL